jgi:hypothetical protein
MYSKNVNQHVILIAAYPVYYGTIHNSQPMEISLMSINNEYVKKWGVYAQQNIIQS